MNSYICVTYICSYIKLFYAVATPAHLYSVVYNIYFVYVAHELRAWILHYSVAVLYNILPDTYYQHHLLLVEAIFLLLKENISKREIKQSSELLKYYCFLFGTLYGKLLNTVDALTIHK